MSWGKYRKLQNFSVRIEKEVTNIDIDGNESVVAISYKIKCIDNARFMAISLSNLADKLTEEIHKIQYKDRDCFLEYESVKENFKESFKENIKAYFAIKIIQAKLMKN